MRTISILVGCCLLAKFASASNVIFTNFSTASKGDTHPVTLSNGALLPAGANTIVAVGFFSSDAVLNLVQAMPNQANWTAALAAFTQFGTATTIGTGAGNTAGLYKQTTGAAVVDGASSFQGKNIYTVIGNSTTLATATEFLVVKSNAQFAIDPTPSANADLVGAASTVMVGSMAAQPTTPYSSGTLAGISMTTVQMAGGPLEPTTPEPAVGLLSLVGLAMGGIRRRR